VWIWIFISTSFQEQVSEPWASEGFFLGGGALGDFS